MIRKAVMYGAGNIGRGFIGKTFSESGCEVCFIDVIKEAVDKINHDGSYPVRIVSNNERREETVGNVHAVHGSDIDRIAQEIAEADIMATAVGVNALPKIIKPICAGLRKRFEKCDKPLNIIICENMIDADKYIRTMVEQEMGGDYKETLDKKLGLVEASIGRMVPVMTDEMREGNILRVWVEPYDILPVDKAAFIGEIPAIRNIEPYAPFGYIIKRKLFIHNLGHAMCAYYGWRKGYKYIYECVEDADIRRDVRAAMNETSAALHKEYGNSKEELDNHINDLLIRFGNRALSDTVDRVARDPLRKLGNNDRLIGAALYCTSLEVDPENITKGIAAALHYDNTSDKTAMEMQKLITESGISGFLKIHCGLREESLVKKILDQY